MAKTVVKVNVKTSVVTSVNVDLLLGTKVDSLLLVKVVVVDAADVTGSCAELKTLIVVLLVIKVMVTEEYSVL